VIDYTEEDFTKGNERYDLVFDAVAKRSFGECRPVLKRGGSYITTLPSARTIFRILTAPILGGPRAGIVSARIDPARVKKVRGMIPVAEHKARIARN